MIVVLFIILYIYAVVIDTNNNYARNKKYRNQILVFICLILAFTAGFRDEVLWADTYIYAHAFKYYTPTIFDIDLSKPLFAYSEKGFYLISSLIRTFTDNSTVYFVCISLITFYYLYKFFKKDCIYPLLGVCVYLARFYEGRNMMQIRGALAIPIVLLATEYIVQKKIWKFLLVVFIAYHIHHSTIIVIPIYFLYNYVDIKKKHIVIGLIIAYAIAIIMGVSMRTWLRSFSFVQEMAYSYVQESNSKSYGLGLSNIMIYYQTALLLLYTFLEKRLAPLSKYYYVIRDAYFYSTVILITLSQFAILSSRLATIYATYECALIPVLVFSFNKKERIFAFIGIGFVLTTFFYLNMKTHM